MIHPVLAFSIGQLELTANEASAFPPVAVGLIAVLCDKRCLHERVNAICLQSLWTSSFLPW